MNSLNFNHLYYFVVIAREGSVSKACKKLFVTQPTLSGQLRQLEDYIGKKLFDRKNRRLVLNKDGELVLSYATQIFRLRDEMLASVKKAQSKSITQVRLGVLPSLSKSHVYELVNSFLKQPNIEVVVNERDFKTLLASIRVGDVDLILSDYASPFEGHKLGAERLFSRDIVVVASPKWKSLRRNFPKSLDDQPYVSFTKHSRIRDEIDLFFYSEHIQPRLIGAMDDVSLLRLFAESGRGFVVIPKNAAKEAISAKRLMILGHLKDMKSDLWAISRKDRDMPAVIEETLASFKKGLRAA